MVAVRLAHTMPNFHCYEVRFDTAFEEVMRGCAARRVTWISETILQVYTELHRRGHAH